MALIVPPYQAPDEQHHFLRAYQISEGKLAANWDNNVGRGELPLSIFQTTESFAALQHNIGTTSFAAIGDALRIPLKPQIRVEYVLATAHYSPLSYLPQAIGIGIGRMMEWPPLVLMYLGRIFNLWAWMGLGYMALRIAPEFGRPLLLLILMPMSLFMAASVSPDAMINGLAFVVTALAFDAAIKKSGSENSVVSWRWVAAFALSTAALAMAKAAYLPLAGLIFVVPATRFGGPKRFAKILLVVVIANAGLVILWTRQTPGLDIVTYLGNPYVSARRQFDFLLGHPKALLLIPIASAQRDGLLVILSFVGRLGWLNIQLSPVFVVVYLALLLMACRPGTEGPTFSRTWRVAAVTAVVAIASVEALLLLLDLIWTSVGSVRVDGLQGRYFIPIAAALLLFAVAVWGGLPTKFRSHRSESQRNLITALIVLASWVYTVTLLYMHYYVSVGVGLV